MKIIIKKDYLKINIKKDYYDDYYKKIIIKKDLWRLL